MDEVRQQDGPALGVYHGRRWRSCRRAHGGRRRGGARTRTDPDRPVEAPAALLDAFLVLGDGRGRVHRAGLRGQRLQVVFGDIIILFFLAWLLAFALLPLIDVGRAPDPARCRARPRWSSSTAASSSWSSSLLVQVSRRPGDVDRGVHPAHPRSSRRSCRTSCAPIAGAARRLGLPGRPRDARRRSSSQNLERLRPGAGRADPAARVREHRAARQPADRRDPVAVHGRSTATRSWRSCSASCRPTTLDEARLLQTASAGRSAGSSAARRDGRGLRR